MESPLTPPWSLILPRLEERAKADAARTLLECWEECAQLFTRFGGSAYLLNRMHGRRAAEGMRALVGADAAAADVQRAWDAIPWPLSFDGERHNLWRLYMFVKGVALFGYVEDLPPKPENWIYRIKHFGFTNWAAECLIEAGRTGVYGPPGESGSVTWQWGPYRPQGLADDIVEC